MQFQTIGFIGLGLIGGSIAKAIKEFHPDIQIMAYTRNMDTLIEAANQGTVDLACTAVDQQFSECDCIFLCAPVSTNARYLEILKPMIKDTCILTDVGSTKTDIHEKAAELGLNAQFIGGHPMAGSEKTGFSCSKRILIENAYYIITPGSLVSQETVTDFAAFIASLKALPLVLHHQQHDYITAIISHLPHLIASSLVNLVEELDDPEGHMKQIAAGGFKDITRIASSSPEMWEQICVTNSEQLSLALASYIKALQELEAQLHEKSGQQLFEFFQGARDYRNSIPDSSLGPIKKQFALYCDMVDEAGGIATLATILATNSISIKNIGIIHNREFEEGVLRVEFYDEASCQKAAGLLRRYRYTIYER